MSKKLLLCPLAWLVFLSSCTPPPRVPPPNFRPNPPYAPTPVPPGGNEFDVSPPPEPDPPSPPTAPGSYPTARSTANPNEVISPYPPYNVIDISGPPAFQSGQLARDPSNQKIFRVP